MSEKPYLHDIFYKSDELPLDIKRDILTTGLRYAKLDDIKIDVLNGFTRESTNEHSFADFHNELTQRDTFKVILRRGLYDPYVGLVGVCQQWNNNEYFLWMYISEKKFNKHIVNKFNLKILV